MNITYYDKIAYSLIIIILIVAAIIKLLCDYYFKCDKKSLK